MNPLDMKYHVVSLVAVFMALGVGILLGSNTNFLDVDTLLKKQDAMITNLEQSQKSLERDNKQVQTKLEDKQDYIKDLEQKTIPLLLNGRLSGQRVALVAVGDFRNAGIDENVVADLLERADATVACRLRMPLEALERLAADYPGDLGADFTRMMFSAPAAVSENSVAPIAAEAATNTIAVLIKDQGFVIQGSLDEPFDAVVFLLGELPGRDGKTGILKTLNDAASANRNATELWVAFGGDKNLSALAKQSGFQVILHAETIPAQVDIVTELWQKFEGKREQFNPETDL